ncbi:hypothetical protein N7541_009105 [Penicillium brevicompactum]|uniref:Uncharacterized protein n=1 Tax=Penicillium brevicompactum TaxID=5074 RepID=A0A9W9QYW8_PENBR|nr:hypothetical protein N7541_009105 [Penicillium brevicompactum]
MPWFSANPIGEANFNMVVIILQPILGEWVKCVGRKFLLTTPTDAGTSKANRKRTQSESPTD